MTLPSSGPLSMQAINAEFGRGNNLNAYRGTVWYTDAGASGTFSSGAISFSEFYGKRPTSPTFSFSIASNQTNADLRTLAVNAGWNQSSAVVATINGGIYISASTTGVYALYIQGSFPGGVTLINNGAIVGAGGNGGRGADAHVAGSTGSSAGAGGGPALYAAVGVTIQNNGTIAGGGGGGGGGSSEIYDDGEGTIFGFAGGGGGGGRASLAMNSSGGGTGAYVSYGGINPPQGGGTGTVNGQGGGGTGQTGLPAFALSGGNGGAGGGWGSGGTAGNRGNGCCTNQYLPASGGGGGGAAVIGNGNITWTAFGTRLGGIS